MSYWKNKRVLISGGSGGLGQALAEAFAAAEADVMAVARDEERLRSMSQRCFQQTGTAPHVFSADLSRPDEFDRLFAHISELWGGLDVLVNNLGRSYRGHVLETSDEGFQESWNINFLSAARATRKAGSWLKTSRGHVINIGSLASKSTSPHLGPYPAAKHALAAYSQQLRWELGPAGVHVLLVCPGPLRRDDAGHRYDDQADGLPESARRPGAGVRLKGISPQRLAIQILKASRKGKRELIVPARARLLFALSQWSPALGDWLVRRMTSGK